MALDKSRAEVERRMQALKAAYDRLVAVAATPVTISDLAEVLNLPRSLVCAMLCRASWWTAEARAASWKEARRRYYVRLKASGGSGMQRARAARSAQPNRRRLTLCTVQTIRARLAQGASLHVLAAEYQRHPNTMLNIKLEKSWRVRPDEPVLPLRVHIQVTDLPQQQHLLLSQDLWDLLGKPARARLTRQRGMALVLEAASDGIHIAVFEAGDLWTLCLPRFLQRCLAIPEQGFISRCSTAARRRLYLSDFPAEEIADMLPVHEASKMLHHSRQWLEACIACGGILAFYDGFRRTRVVRRLDQPTQPAEPNTHPLQADRLCDAPIEGTSPLSGFHVTLAARAAFECEQTVLC